RSLWFTERDGNRISRLTPAGELTRFDLPTAGSRPSSIASAPNGDLWFTEWAGRIAKLSLQGELREYDLPAIAPDHPSDLLIGADGIVWIMFNTGKTIARFDPQSETFTMYPVGTISASLSDFTLGPDNRVWFVGTHSAGSFDLSGGFPGPVTEDPLLKPVFDYQGRSQIIAGPDNDLFFTTANTNTVFRSPLPGAPSLRDLQVFVTYHPPVVLSAGPFNIDAQIVNWTNADATDLEIHLSLDESIHFVSADVPGGACTGGSSGVDCTLATLAAGDTLPVSFVMTTDRITTSPVERTLILEVTSAEGDYKPADNRVVLFTTIQTSLDYFNDFSAGADAHWSQPVTRTPVPGLDVLGLFDNDDVIFDWDSLPPHDQTWVCFDLYVSGPWSGSQYLDPGETTIIGPDLWTHYLDDNRLLLTTFSNQQRYQQAFPANYPGALSAYQTGSVQVGEFDGDPSVQDARYSFCYQHEHRNQSLELLFKGLNLNEAAQEQWSLDNVRIKILYDASIDRTFLPLLRR
ncbi:MAG TPA: hypothetical protein VFF68_07540, partial [Anaerolineaceae bacterium]|nr:hypothetical protein [Anaerolineaceae bacterium]